MEETKNLLLILATIILLCAVILNIIAYRHAYAMLHFTQEGTRTKQPEAMGFSAKIKTLLTGVNIPRPSNERTPKDVNLEFTTHRFPSTYGIELEAWYIPAEKAKGIILPLHGYTSSKSYLLDVTKAFYEMGYSTFTIDFRGSGGSSGNDTSVGFHEADDVCNAVEFIRNNISKDIPVILYGQSMGGAAALRAIAEKELRPDILIIEGVFSEMLLTVKARFNAMRIPSFPGAHLLTFWGGQQMGFSAFKHNPVNYALKVKCPTLVLNGEEDPRATVEQAKNIFKNLKGPKAMALFTDAGHESCYNANPEQWRKTMADFLEETR